jgi:DNA-binding GntR family transcriptional regulator
MSLYAPANRPRLMELIGQMHRRGERYLRLKLGLPIHKDASDAEHRAILAALAARDIEQAQTLVARHLLATGELIHRFLADAQALAHTTHVRKRRRASSRTTSRQEDR